jgi:hypothetical protein
MGKAQSYIQYTYWWNVGRVVFVEELNLPSLKFGVQPIELNIWVTLFYQSFTIAGKTAQ